MKWNSLSQAGQQIAQLITITVLARLLTPADFGIVGMATVVLAFVGLFKDLGTSAAVIQCREATEELLSSVFWANVGFGALGTIAVAACAPLAAAYYHEPRVTSVLRVLALTFVISGSSNLQKALFERNLSFRAPAWSETLGVAAGAAVGVGLALGGAGVWALVAQSLLSVSITTVLLWYFSSWRPRFGFHWQELRRVSGFSLHIMGFNLVNYFSRNADYLLIGRYLGAEQLGIYTLAYRIMLYPLQSVSTVVARVMFPAYSQLQDDDARFRAAYLRTVNMIALVTFPLNLGIYCVARPFVLGVFGAKWALVIPLIAILTPVGLVQSVTHTVGSIYQAKGRAHTYFNWGVFSSLVVVTGFVVGLRWGIVGVAASYAVSVLLLTAPCFMIPFRYIGLRVTTFCVALWRPLVASLLMAAVVVLAGKMLVFSSPLVALAVLIAIGAGAYPIATWLVNREYFALTIQLIGKPRAGA